MAFFTTTIKVVVPWNLNTKWIFTWRGEEKHVHVLRCAETKKRKMCAYQNLSNGLSQGWELKKKDEKYDEQVRQCSFLKENFYSFPNRSRHWKLIFPRFFLTHYSCGCAFFFLKRGRGNGMWGKNVTGRKINCIGT